MQRGAGWVKITRLWRPQVKTPEPENPDPGVAWPIPEIRQ